MSRGPSTFRRRDLKAAVEAVRATGEPIAGVEIAPDGTIRVLTGAVAGNPAPVPDGGLRGWEDV